MKSLPALTVAVLLPAFAAALPTPKNFDDSKIRVALECPGTNGPTWKTATREVWEKTGRTYRDDYGTLERADEAMTAKYAAYSAKLAEAIHQNFKTVMAKTNWRTDIDIQRERFKIPEMIGDCRTVIWWLQEQLGGYDEISFVGRKDILAKLNPAEVVAALSGTKLNSDQISAEILSNENGMTLQEFSKRGQYNLIGFSYPYAEADDLTYGGFDLDTYVTWYDEDHIRVAHQAKQRPTPWPVVQDTPSLPSWVRSVFEIEFHPDATLSRIEFKYNHGEHRRLAVHLKDPSQGRIVPTAETYYYYPNGSMRATTDEVRSPSGRAVKMTGEIPNTKITTVPYFGWVVFDKNSRARAAYIGEFTFGEYKICTGVVLIRPDGTLKSAAFVPVNQGGSGCYHVDFVSWGEFDAAGKLTSKSNALAPYFSLLVSGTTPEQFTRKVGWNETIGRVEPLFTENDRLECRPRLVNGTGLEIAPNCWSFSLVWPVKK